MFKYYPSHINIMPKNGMERTTVLLPEKQLKSIDSMVDEGKYPTRSEAIRCAVRDLVAKGG